MARQRAESVASDYAIENAAEHADEVADQAEPEAEVRPDEITRGTDVPVWRSPFPAIVVDALRAPLDPNRVRRRKGRGGGQFEYLAGHDVKRRANEIFGFGNWGTKVVRIEKLGQVKIVSGDKEGWHVGYMAVVQVRVRTEAGDWVSYEDDGYGDGAEYGPAAFITSRELAVKECVTDAFKRACTYLGDQFGLILYAKEDEKRRIARDDVSAEAQPAVRVNPQGPRPPQNWTEALTRFDKLMGTNTNASTYDATADDASHWLAELSTLRFGEPSVVALKSDERNVLFIGFASALLALEDEEGEIALMPGLRDRIARAFSVKNDGVALYGPMYRLGPDDPDTLPSKTDYNQGKGEPDGDDSKQEAPADDRG